MTIWTWDRTPSAHHLNAIRSLALAWCLLSAPSVSALDAQTILRQVELNMLPDSVEMYRKLVNINPEGDRREFVMYSIKQGRDSVANLFLSPPTVKGQVTLRLGRNMWLTFPEVEQPVRTTSLHSVAGGIFNNWDLMRVSLGVEYDVEGMDETETEYIFDLKAKTTWVPYDRLKVWVEKEQLLARRVDAFTASGTLIKTLHFKSVKDFGEGIVRPSVVETVSPLTPGHMSVMIFGEIRRREFPEEVFTLAFMKNMEGLR